MSSAPAILGKPTATRLKITIGSSSQLNKVASTSSSSSVGGANAVTTSNSSSSAAWPLGTLNSPIVTGGNADIKLFDLCHVKRGHRGSRKKKSDATASNSSELQTSDQGKAAKVTASTTKQTTEPTAKKQKSTGPRVEFVDGKMVIKESSLELAQDGMDDDYVYEEVMEEGGQSSVTYTSFMHKAKPLSWGLQETWLFYQALRQCGTDFSLMQTFFPGRTRDSLKKKFFREEKAHPELVKRTLTTGIPLDMGVFSTFFGDESLLHAGESSNVDEATALPSTSSDSKHVQRQPTTTSTQVEPPAVASEVAADPNIICV